MYSSLGFRRTHPCFATFCFQECTSFFFFIFFFTELLQGFPILPLSPSSTLASSAKLSTILNICISLVALSLQLLTQVFFFFITSIPSSSKNLHAMECPREIRAVQRALLLPSEERADGLRSWFGLGPAPGRMVSFSSLWFRRSRQLFHRGWLSSPRVEGWKWGFWWCSFKADNVSNEALYVIGLHGSGDGISLYMIGRWQK